MERSEIYGEVWNALFTALGAVFGLGAGCIVVFFIVSEALSVLMPF